MFTTMIETRFNNSFTYSVKLNEGYPYHRCDPNSLVVLFISKWYTCITSISYLFSYLHVCHSDDSNWNIIHVNSNTLSRHWQFLRKNYLFLRKFRFIEISFEKILQGKNYFLVRKNINLIWNTFNWISIFKGEYFIFQVWQNIKHCK